ncbi:MAG: pro-sigmaK processing inhibitor BofA family protein [Bacilli bacterium]|nr:pro-sigmaK processing inhibitor BofA family protein [Bacilli bacterium]
MKKFWSILKKFVFSTFLLYGYNLIAVNFNLVVPINFLNIVILMFLGAPGLLSLVLFKLIIM